MSRDLPSRPDLEHLKKQAKALLRSMRERDANATLADALHALARDYGFASWPKLKAHVESGFSRISGASPSASSSSAPLFPRFTEAAKRCSFAPRGRLTWASRDCSRTRAARRHSGRGQDHARCWRLPGSPLTLRVAPSKRQTRHATRSNQCKHVSVVNEDAVHAGR